MQTAERGGRGGSEGLKAFHDPRHEWRRLVAETWGTFLLVLVAAGAAIVATQVPLGEAAKQAAPGLMVMIIIYFMGTVSGAHLNPAVTLAFALRRNFPWSRVPGYVAAQLIGALLAALFLRSIFGAAASAGETMPNPGLPPLAAFAIETVITTALVNTILGTAAGGRNVGANGAIAVGSCVALGGLWAGSLSGGSMNPARSLGPELVDHHLAQAWLYLGAPLLGAALGAGLEWVLRGPPSKWGTMTAQGSDDPAGEHDGRSE